MKVTLVGRTTPPSPKVAKLLIDMAKRKYLKLKEHNTDGGR
jgi:hypothetical protein